MKSLLIVVLLCPAVVFAQNKNSLTLLGGGEFHDTKTVGWDVELHFNRQFANALRWSSEFGVNFSSSAYTSKLQDVIPSSEPIAPSSGVVIDPGYHEDVYVQSSKSKCIRLQAGANYTLVSKEKLRFSVGLNVVNELRCSYRENGQRILTPVFGYGDTLEVVNTHYSLESDLKDRDNVLRFQLQPHLDLAIRLSETFWFKSRLAYYAGFLPTIESGMLQLNLGLVFQW